MEQTPIHLDSKLPFEEKIKAAKNFEELYSVLYGEGTIKGSKETLTTDDLWQKIQNIRSIGRKGEKLGKGQIQRSPLLGYITRSNGIRQKVVELCEKEFGVE